jgi:hypothetical protein
LREAINALSQGKIVKTVVERGDQRPFSRKSIKKVVEKAEQRPFSFLRKKRKKALIESS